MHFFTQLFIRDGEPKIKALDKETTELKNDLSQMIDYLGQDALTRAEDIFGALSTFKSSLAVSFLRFSLLLHACQFVELKINFR